MLPKKRKVERHLFDQTLHKTRICGTDFFTIRTFHSKEEQNAKVAVIVSKKVEKKAVGRNLIKRRVYGVIENLGENVKHSYVLFIFPKKNASGLPFSKFKEELELLLAKAEVLTR